MRKSAFVLCVLLSPFVHCRPQYPPVDNLQNSQDYTDSPDAQLITYIAEKTGAIRQPPAAAPVFGPRSRGQTQYTVAAPQPQQIFAAAPPQSPVEYTPQSLPSPSPPPQRPQSFQRLRPSALPPAQQPTQQDYVTASPDEPRGRHQTTTYIPILRLDKSQSLDGSYRQSWETGNNIQAEETGFLKKIGAKEDQEALVQQGAYSYTAPDGTIIKTTYTADEGGFRVEGDHLPKPPPIPEEIQKGLAQIYEGIRLQQEADAREAKQGKVKGTNYYDQNSNTVTENYPQPTYQQQQYLQLESDQNNVQPYQRQRFRQ